MKHFLLFATLLVSFVSCKKENNTAAATRTQLLTSSPWVYESGGVDTDGNGTIDLNLSMIGIPPCVTDNKGIFNTNGTGVNDEGPTKCDPTAPQTTPFNWAFTNNESNLTISGNAFLGLSGSFRVRTLTSTQLTISRDTSVMGLSMAILLNLKH